jgi:DNA repair protein RecO (recombination protein O)
LTQNMRVHQQSAYVLLNRPYSETSWIVEIFSREYGRMALMAKGARRIKSHLKGVLQPFQPVLLSWTGKGEVPTLTSAEIDQSEYSFLHHELQGDGLVCGFYCNELLVKLLHRHDPHPQLFDCYHATVVGLNSAQENDNLANALRIFEQALMRETGYEVSFTFESDGKTPIDEAGLYRFQPGQGFVRLANMQNKAVSGRAIHSMLSENQHQFSHDEVSQGKYLMREILSHIMGHQKIVSRGLFFPKTRT